jgi:hypothetical protein
MDLLAVHLRPLVYLGPHMTIATFNVVDVQLLFLVAVQRWLFYILYVAGVTGMLTEQAA